MPSVATFLWGISWLAIVAMIVCFIMVLIAMFSNQQLILAIVCAVLAPLIIGFLIAFVFGWLKASEWSIQKVMIGWSAAAFCWIVCYVAGIAAAIMFPAI